MTARKISLTNVTANLNSAITFVHASGPLLKLAVRCVHLEVCMFVCAFNYRNWFVWKLRKFIQLHVHWNTVQCNYIFIASSEMLPQPFHDIHRSGVGRIDWLGRIAYADSWAERGGVRVRSVVVGLLFSLELHLSLCILMCMNYTCRQYSWDQCKWKRTTHAMYQSMRTKHRWVWSQ